MIISFEGGEGSGKSSVIKGALRLIQTHGMEVCVFREPGDTEIGEQIRNILHDHKNSNISLRTEALLYQAARSELVDKKIRPAIERGVTVLLDRFYDSSIVYQGMARGLGIEEILHLTRFATGGLDPDLTFYLDVDVQEGLRRIRENKREFNRMDAQPVEFYEKVREAYLNLCRENLGGRWVYINANQEFPNVMLDVTKELNERIFHEGAITRERGT
ncbi:MAG: dTMP kinase [Candidatus Woesebacteria bacterium]|nr:MAG: dTMP kinase [Candidatus Woesebacteria bacterium]